MPLHQPVSECAWVWLRDVVVVVSLILSVKYISILIIYIGCDITVSSVLF